jgi:O-antigen/teichoic acid export membrane protein
MKRQFAINIVLLVFINLLIKPVYIFFIEARVQDVLGHAAYGKYFTYLNFALLFQFLADLGTQSWNAQYLSKNRNDGSRVFSDIFFLRVLLGMIYIFSICLFAWLTGWFDMLLIVYLAFQAFFSTSLVFVRSSITSLGHYKTDNLLSVADKILMIAGLGWLLYFMPERHFSVIDFAVIQTGALLAANLLAIALLILQGGVILVKPDFSSWWSILRKSAPYMVIALLMMAYNKLDGLLLGTMSPTGTSAAGVYAAAFRIYDAMNMIGYLMAGLLLPMFASLIGEKKYPGHLAGMAFQMMWTVCLPIVFVIVVFPDQILDTIYSTPQDQAIASLQWLSVSFIMINIGYIYGTLMVAADQGSRLVGVFATGLVINFTGNILLIPVLGPTGAAITCFVTQSLVAAGQLRQAMYKLQLTISRYQILTGVKFSMLTVSGILILCQLSIPWYIIALISLLISLLLSYVTGWLKWSDFNVRERLTE